MGSSIFHTSHSGSTLLAYMLAPFKEVYSEPAWTHEIIRDKKSPASIETSENILYKYPSGLCHLAPKVSGPKIFLYRNLGEHLLKLRANRDTNYIDYYYDYFQLYCHPLLRDMDPTTLPEKHTFMWAHRVFWVMESEVEFIRTSDFLLNLNPTMAKICEVFNIKNHGRFSFPPFHVKSAGYNHQEVPLDQVKPKERVYTTAQQGIIPEAVAENSVMVTEAREWLLRHVQVDRNLL